MQTILFQGDSITDAGRSREHDDWFGRGYASLVRAKLGCDKPGQYHMLNRGISGNRVVDLYARIKSDIINLAPDYMSIMIGVNDVWHELDFHNGVAAEKYERIYDMLLTEVKEALPHVRMMIMEPYVLCGSGTAVYYDVFKREVKLRAAAAKRLANKHNCLFLPLQDKLTALADEQESAPYWLCDGVHPTAFGHELIAREWLAAFEKLI